MVGKCYIEEILNHNQAMPLMNNLPRPVIQHCCLSLVSLGLHHGWWEKSIKMGFSLFHSRRVEGVKAELHPHPSVYCCLLDVLSYHPWDQMRLVCQQWTPPNFTFRGIRGCSPSSARPQCPRSMNKSHDEHQMHREQVSARAHCQISTVLPRRADILHRLASIVMVCRSLYPVCLFSLTRSLTRALSLSLSLSSCFSVPPTPTPRKMLMLYWWQRWRAFTYTGAAAAAARLRLSSHWMWNDTNKYPLTCALTVAGEDGDVCEERMESNTHRDQNESRQFIFFQTVHVRRICFLCWPENICEFIQSEVKCFSDVRLKRNLLHIRNNVYPIQTQHTQGE